MKGSEMNAITVWSFLTTSWMYKMYETNAFTLNASL